MRSDKILSVQALRGLAAVMVLVGHALAEAEHYFQTSFALSSLPWTRGVDLFFVVSGFIIVVASINRDGETVRPADFLRRRFLRVVPLYWFYTSLMVVALIAIPSGVKDTQLDIAQIIHSYLFIPYERYDGRVAPVLSLGWTLNYEIYFYVVFAGLLTMGLHRAVTALFGAFCILSFLGYVVDFKSTILDSWTHSLIMEFVFGALIGYYFICRGRLENARTSVGIAGIAVGLLLLVLFNALSDQPGDALEFVPRFVLAGVPAAIVVTSGVLLLPHAADAKVPGILVAIGDSSYSLYLSHRFVLRPLTMIWQRFLPMNTEFAVIYVCVACVSALIAAYVAFLMIERPFLRWASGSRQRHATAGS